MKSVKSSFPFEILKYFTKTSCHQAHWKKDSDKRYIKNWRPISLLNVDTKIVSKALSNKLKTVLPASIFSKQTAYVKSRFIGESGRLISDIIEISGCFNITGVCVTVYWKSFWFSWSPFSYFRYEKVWFWQTLLPG